MVISSVVAISSSNNLIVQKTFSRFCFLAVMRFLKFGMDICAVWSISFLNAGFWAHPASVSAIFDRLSAGSSAFNDCVVVSSCVFWEIGFRVK